MAKITRETARIQFKSPNVHNEYAHGLECGGVDAPFALPHEILHVFTAEDGAAVLACAECRGVSLVPESTAECPQCGSDLVAPAGTHRRSYSREADLTAFASWQDIEFFGRGERPAGFVLA